MNQVVVVRGAAVEGGHHAKIAVPGVLFVSCSSARHIVP